MIGLYFASQIQEYTNKINEARVANGLKPLQFSDVMERFAKDEKVNMNFGKDNFIKPFLDDIDNELKAVKIASKKVPKGSISGIIDDVAKIATEPAAVAAGAAGVGMEVLRDRKNRMQAIEASKYKPEFTKPKVGMTEALGAAGALYSMYDQYKAATGQYGNNYMDKEYGASDPFSLRPMYDAMLRQGSVSDMAVNPEWVQRNPIASVPYGVATGQFQYPEAFFSAYTPENLSKLPMPIPEWMKGELGAENAPRPQYSPVSQPMR